MLIIYGVSIVLCFIKILDGSRKSRYGLGTRPTSLFYLFARVYADWCTVNTMNFWYNEQSSNRVYLAEALYRAIQIITG